MSRGFMSSLFRKKSDEKEPTIRKKSDEKEPTNFGLARVFKHEELEKATNSFTTELGVGGFGSVYLGTLTDGRKVAVKLLHDNNPRQLQQFVNEIIVLSRLRHKNLVTLIGCTNPRHRKLLLVYEYVPNSTVDDHLHIRRSDLTLAIRVQIATETAEALVYLHALDPPLIHRDVKTSNIMLDKDFHVKLGDLGLCRLLPWDTTQVLTEAQGTLGYRDPEYDRTCILTVKSDVYSFGMMLVELISGQKVVDVNRAPVFLADFALNKIVKKKFFFWGKIVRKELDDIVDPKLGYNNNIHHKRIINSLAKLAVKCLHSTGIERPTMEQVLTELKNIDNELQELNASRIDGTSVVGGILVVLAVFSIGWLCHDQRVLKAKEEGGEQSGIERPTMELKNVDNELQGKGALNASLIDGTSRITCLKQRFRDAVIKLLVIILCYLWFDVSYCKAKEEGGENYGTGLIACLIQRLCATVPLMLILCCLWHYRSQCTSMIRSQLEMYSVAVILALVLILGGKHSGTSWITHLKELYLLILVVVAMILVPLILILCCLWYYTSLSIVSLILILCWLW